MRILAWPARTGRRDSPYPYMLATALEARGHVVEEMSLRRLGTQRYDIVHVHWPDSVLYRPGAAETAARVAALVGLFGVARARGGRLVWTVHNLRSHETHHPRSAALLDRGFLPQVDGWISLTEAGVDDVVREFPALADRPHEVIPSGHYASEYPGTADRAEARRALGIAPGAELVLFFGQIRPYKNVVGLLRAFKDVDRPDAVLLVAGRPLTEQLADDVRAEATGDERVQLRLGFVEPTEVQALFRAADLAVLPYTEVFNSGSAILSVTFGCPVLVPAVGALAELGQLVGEGWVRTYTGELRGEAIAGALAASRPPGEPDLSALDWSTVSEATDGFYERLLASRRRRRS